MVETLGSQHVRVGELKALTFVDVAGEEVMFHEHPHHPRFALK
jgi:hypothetical protein